MSNPYSAPTLSGYNASPPADDGTAAATNQVEWQKHLDKIGDPLRTYAIAVDAAALAAFGLTFGAGVLSQATAYTVAAADRGRIISVTGTTTITLLAAASAGDGFPICIINTGAAVVTVDGNSSETINGSTTVTLQPGTGLIITCNGTAWFGLIANLDISGLPAIQGNAIDPANDGYLVDNAGEPNRMAHSDAGFVLVDETGTSRTLATADMNTVIRCDNAATITVTLNTGVGVVGNWVKLIQWGAGQVQMAGTSTRQNANGEDTALQYSALLLECVAADTWLVTGDTT